MAGIGFTLRKLQHRDGLVGPMAAFLYATMISAGPLIVSAITFALLNFSSPLQSLQQRQIFLSIIAYAFAFSVIGGSGYQMAAARVLADRLYVGNSEGFSNAYFQLLFPLLGIQWLLGTIFFRFAPVPPLVEWGAMLLYLSLNGIWLAMVFLSAAKDYHRIAMTFSIGLGITLLCGLWGGARFELVGQMLGVSLGFLYTFFALACQLEREFGGGSGLVPGLERAILKYPLLILTGLAYSLGFWGDKILFWYGPGVSQSVTGILRMAPIYDNALLYPYLSVIPVSGLFLLRVETDFYDSYRAYFSAIADHRDLDGLLALKEKLAAVLRHDLGLLLKIQGSITLVLMLLAPEVMAFLHVPLTCLFVFRVGLLGAFLNALLLIVMVLLLYFDRQDKAAILTSVFLLSNAGVTLLSLRWVEAHGFGFAIAGALSLFLGILLLDDALRDLEYNLFMRQPLPD